MSSLSDDSENEIALILATIALPQPLSTKMESAVSIGAVGDAAKENARRLLRTAHVQRDEMCASVAAYLAREKEKEKKKGPPASPTDGAVTIGGVVASVRRYLAAFAGIDAALTSTQGALVASKPCFDWRAQPLAPSAAPAFERRQCLELLAAALIKHAHALMHDNTGAQLARTAAQFAERAKEAVAALREAAGVYEALDASETSAVAAERTPSRITARTLRNVCVGMAQSLVLARARTPTSTTSAAASASLAAAAADAFDAAFDAFGDEKLSDKLRSSVSPAMARFVRTQRAYMRAVAFALLGDQARADFKHGRALACYARAVDELKRMPLTLPQTVVAGGTSLKDAAKEDAALGDAYATTLCASVASIAARQRSTETENTSIVGHQVDDKSLIEAPAPKLLTAPIAFSMPLPQPSK